MLLHAAFSRFNVVYERIGRRRPAEELPEQLGGRYLSAEAQQIFADPGIPTRISRITRSNRVRDACAYVCCQNGPRAVVDHIPGLPDELHTHGPPRPFRMRLDPQVVGSQLSPHLVGICLRIAQHANLEETPGNVEHDERILLVSAVRSRSRLSQILCLPGWVI